MALSCSRSTISGVDCAVCDSRRQRAAPVRIGRRPNTYRCCRTRFSGDGAISKLLTGGTPSKLRCYLLYPWFSISLEPSTVVGSPSSTSIWFLFQLQIPSACCYLLRCATVRNRNRKTGAILHFPATLPAAYRARSSSSERDFDDCHLEKIIPRDEISPTAYVSLKSLKSFLCPAISGVTFDGLRWTNVLITGKYSSPRIVLAIDRLNRRKPQSVRRKTFSGHILRQGLGEFAAGTLAAMAAELLCFFILIRLRQLQGRSCSKNQPFGDLADPLRITCHHQAQTGTHNKNIGTFTRSFIIFWFLRIKPKSFLMVLCFFRLVGPFCFSNFQNKVFFFLKKINIIVLWECFLVSSFIFIFRVI